MKIHGRNAIKEAIAAGTTVDRLVVQKGQSDIGANKLIEEARKRGIKIDFRDKEALDREVKEGRHQGFIAEITDYKYAELEDIINEQENELIIIADGIEDPHNLGSVLRVAECAGVSGVIIPDRRSVSVNETVIRISAGAANHVKVVRVSNINKTIDELKKRNFFVFAAEADGESVYKSNLRGKIAVCIGGEDKGVHELTKKKCDGVISLKMHGKVNSLNASVACGIIVFEALRQREEC